MTIRTPTMMTKMMITTQTKQDPLKQSMMARLLQKGNEIDTEFKIDS